jgi:hypothetical protein
VRADTLTGFMTSIIERQHVQFALDCERHNKKLEPTPVCIGSSSFAVDITSPAWLSLRR